MSVAKRWDVLGVGCNSVDYVYRIPVSPQAGSATAKQPILTHARMCGGQAATAMAACAALGLRASYLGAIGADDNGRLIASALDRSGVDMSPAIRRECDNRFAVITVDDSGDRVVLWHRDPRLNLAPEEITPDLLHSATVVHVDDEDQEAAIIAARVAAEGGVPVTSDIDRVTSRTRELIDAVSIPIFAEHVLPELTGEPNVEAALRDLRRAHHQMLCVTLGASGSAMLVNGEWIYEPGVEVTAVDTTGAGDVFRAAFIFGLSKTFAPDRMLRFANAAAALSCTRAGAMAGVPSLNEVDRLLTVA